MQKSIEVGSYIRGIFNLSRIWKNHLASHPETTFPQPLGLIVYNPRLDRAQLNAMPGPENVAGTTAVGELFRTSQPEEPIELGENEMIINGRVVVATYS